MELDKELKISWATVQSLILSARQGMPNNFYHNWTHIADVVQVPATMPAHGSLHTQQAASPHRDPSTHLRHHTAPPHRPAR